MTYDHIPIGYEVIDSADFAAARLVLNDPTSSDAVRHWAVRVLLYSRRHADIELCSREIAGCRKCRPVRRTATDWLEIFAAVLAVLAVMFVGYQLGRLGMLWWTGMGEVLQRAAETGGM